MLSVRNLTKTYKLSKKKGSKKVVALNNVSIDFPEKGLIFLLGKSGSGKSTLLNAIGGLDTFDSGEIIIKGKSSKDFKQSDFDSYRNTFIGFIFQEYNILEEFTVGKNLALALELQGKNAKREDVEALLKQVDLEGYYKRKPNQLSGGQKQRVAIARALIKDPEIIMADEPTGALDSNTGKQVMDTLKKLSKTKLVIIVSHDREFAEIYGDRVIELKDGKIISDKTKTEVEARKTETGVSFIGESLIHIKKGQKLTKNDLILINKQLIHNVNNNDTIISFDNKSNEEIKKVAFITDEGNREVFKNTSKEDVNLKNYDPKKFKLIKSKLKMKDSFKMGASSLKHKPIRLIFTILLACVSFAMFGLVDTMASFNRTTSIYESLETLDTKTLAVTRNYEEGYSKTTLNMPTEDFEKLATDNPNYSFYPVIYSNEYFDLQNISTSSSNNPLYSDRISGIISVDDSRLSALNLRLQAGRLPEADDEVCISTNMFNTLCEISSSISSFEDINGERIRLNRAGYWTIVGIIQDDTDISKYVEAYSSNDSSSISNYLMYSEIETVLNYGLVNMCYVSPTSFENLLSDYTIDDSYRVDIGNENANPSIYESNAYTYDEFITRYPDTSYNYTLTYIKPRTDIENLQDNQIVVYYDSNYYSSEEELQTKIDDGYTIRINYYYDSPAYEELEVVGYYRNNNFNYIISQNLKDKLFGGYDYAITRLHQNNSDRDLVNYIEGNDSIIKLGIQFSATPMFDNFVGMIESMRQVFLYVGIGFAVFAALMLMNFIATSITYKKREIGVLRAIGARGKDVFSIFFSESFIICVINFLLSTIACIVACYFINRSLLVNLGFTITLLSFGIRQIILLFGVSLLVAFVSSFIPVYRIAKKNPIDSINNR